MVSYNVHFFAYNTIQKQLTHLIPKCNVKILPKLHEAPFTKETLKDCLQETLKELNIYAIIMKIVQNKQHYNVIMFCNDWKPWMGMQVEMY
jgi:hypothetical protein